VMQKTEGNVTFHTARSTAFPQPAPGTAESPGPMKNVAADKLRPHDHPGVEFIYAIQGALSVHVGADEHVLKAGDSIYFDSSVPHAYRRSGGRTCSAVVVTAR